MNTRIGNKLFQDIPRRVAKFRENQLRDVEKSVDEKRTRMWANAQRDGYPAEYRWRPLFNAAASLTSTTRVPCSNAAKTRNPL